ncbi:hypothetical protein [Robertkochia aurantiaca]|uniref:hypothetical protein n=1 Tax=Robertkochia aurantiaca TaxID=2873700 RepID=UPI001CCA7871|nr:hypothetical protein [Robertkochia sp. 3YJGBD-33]
MKFKSLLFYNSLLMTLLSCSYDYGQLKIIADMPELLNENSALETLPGSPLIWTIADSGNDDHIYGLDRQGNIIKDLNVENADNDDWEDLATAPDGTLFIGDFGNNDNDRDDLVIYRVRDVLKAEDDVEAEAIRFYYPEQKDFPPKKEDFHYDAEAMYFSKGYLYVITKNRSSDFDGSAYVYKIPAEPGEHAAELLGTLKTCDEQNTCFITGADISADGKTVVLLGHNKIWTISNFKNDDITTGEITVRDMEYYSQKEGICFSPDETHLLISDERRGISGGNLYELVVE